MTKQRILLTLTVICGLFIGWCIGSFISPFRGTKAPETIHPIDYQISLHFDTVWLYDGSRLVGSYINTKWDSQLDSLILKDNQ